MLITYKNLEIIFIERIFEKAFNNSFLMHINFKSNYNSQSNKTKTQGVIMRLSFTRLLFLAIAALVLSVNSLVFAQGITSAAINGIVTDQNGEPLPSATVVAVHEPSGTQYGLTTRDNGAFNLLGLRVGGPYTVTVSYIGYETQKKKMFT